VTLRLRDDGRTVSLREGDELVLSLGSPGRSAAPSGPGSGWTLTSYPENAVDLVASDAAAGTFRLRAVHTSSGRILASLRQPCPMLETCPDASVSFTATVRVT
jgi:hypothetical protein